MKTPIAIILLSAFLFTGCSLVPTDFMPKFVWYWSCEAKAHRAEVQAAKDWQRTNTVNRIPTHD